jgi:hypothetical protein
MLNTIRTTYSQLDERRDALFHAAEDLFDGTRKRQVSDWWLHHIEEQVTIFLQSRGFNFEAIPDQYLDVPPSDLDAIMRNLNIVSSLLQGKSEFDPHLEQDMDDFLERTVSNVYVEVEKFSSDLHFAIGCNWESLNLDLVPTDRQGRCMKDDYEYLQKMKEMDEAIRERRMKKEKEGKRAMMSDVVPIGGLVMARFHILECELRSILMKWKRRAPINPMPSPSAEESVCVSPSDLQISYDTSTDYISDDSDASFEMFVLSSSPPAITSSCKYVLFESGRQRFARDNLVSQYPNLIVVP